MKGWTGLFPLFSYDLSTFTKGTGIHETETASNRKFFKLFLLAGELLWEQNYVVCGLSCVGVATEGVSTIKITFVQ